jgi:signal transduction histidine kinase
MRNRLTVWAFVLILLAIPVLGYVQWRWIDRVTEAELERESARLRSALDRLTSDFNAEVTRAHMFFAPDPREAEVDAFSRLFADWNSRAPFPAIVKDILVVYPEDGTAVRILRSGEIQRDTPVPAFRNEGGPVGTVGGEPALMMGVGGPGQMQGLGGRGFGFPPRPEGPPPAPWRPRMRILVLDADTLANKLLPRLLDRHLDTRIYRASVKAPTAIVFGTGVESPDISGALIAVRPDCLLQPNQPGPGRRGLGPPWMRPRLDTLTLPVHSCSVPADEGFWRIDVQHSAGSLAHAMQAVRRQNLSLSFGVLALLTGAVVALWVSIHRARMLAQRQVEFAMSVSHELRTPLTVMRLAGDNLASGKMIAPEQVKRYGETIRTQAERLGNMVEQVLTFARSERPDWHVRTDSVRPEAILEAALASAESVLRDSRCEVQSEAEPELPVIEADANLMTSAVSNLLVNSARYGASGGWIRARVFADRAHVVFEVADRGPGIPSSDVRRVFQPFYRGRNSGGSRGAGLGLHLVRRIVTAHGGTVAIDSSPGVGTTVRIELPIPLAKEEAAGEAASADRRG